MFHKIKNVAAMPDFKLSVQFSEGVTKIYDVKPLFDRIPAFKGLKNNQSNEKLDKHKHWKKGSKINELERRKEPMLLGEPEERAVHSLSR